MKKVLSFLLSCTMLVCMATVLTGCGGSDDGDVHVFYYNYSDTYISSVRSALGKQLSDAGVKYQDYDANGNQIGRASCRERVSSPV